MRHFGLILALSLAATTAAGAASPAYTATNEKGEIEVTLKDHRFTPAELRVPVGQKVLIRLKNADNTADEFDSSALKVEKVVAGGAEGTIRLRALEKGRYPFMGEFHSETAQGVVIAE